MEGSPIVRDRGKLRKIVGEIIKKNLNFSCLTIDMIYDRTLVDPI